MTELTIQIPSWLKKEEAEKEFLRTLLRKARLKMEFYRSKMKPYENKYGLTFIEFQNKLTSTSREIFEEWEAYYTAFAHWEGRYRELAQCLEK
ncbi:MAG: hypothetical protein ONB05_03740 [candidate division KSB1 bacterium]|nr:hypothetical protein [candidate division KSB1 bacterium]